MTSRHPRISKGWIEAWAAEYGDYDSSRVEDLFGKAKPTYDDIERVYRWKSARSVGHFLTNDAEHVVSTVRSALRAKGDAAALARVETLNGVKARTGSALLAIFRPERFTVMDWRARQTLEAFGHLQDLRTSFVDERVAGVHEPVSRHRIPHRRQSPRPRSRAVERAGKHRQTLTLTTDRTDGLLH